MATVDNLNFKVILDDKEFNKKLKELEKIAQTFNTTMSNLLNLKNSGAQISQREVQNQRRLKQLKVDEVRAQEKINREKMKTEGLQRKINAQVDRAAGGSKKMAVSWQQASSAFLQMAAFTGFATLIKDIVRITGEFEVQKTTLGAMLRDLGAAEHLMGKLKELAVESPFTFLDLSKYTKQLTAFSVPEEELFETTKMIADLSAGLGVAADRLILAYGQVKSAAFLRGQEVRQFTEAGIPILKDLAKEFEKVEGAAVSVGEVFDRISARQVSFEMVAKVLRDMTSEGGKFYNMQQIQADTLWGRMQKLKDQWQIALDAMGRTNEGIINKSIDKISDFVKNWEKVGRVLKMLIISFGAYSATLLTVWAVQKGVAGVKLYQAFMAGTKGVAGFTAALKAANLTLSGFLGFAGGLIGLIIGFATSFKKAKEETHDLDAELGELYDNATQLQHKFDADIRSLKELTRGTQNYRDALASINETYGEYLPKLLSEADTYEEIENAVSKARNAIIEMQRQRAIDSMRKEVSRVYEEEAKNYNNVMAKLTKKGYEFFNTLVARGKILKDEFDVLDLSSQAGFTWMTEPGKALAVSTEEFRKAVNYILLMQEEERRMAERIDEIYAAGSYTTVNEFNIINAAKARKEEALKALKEEELATAEYRDRELQITKDYLNELIRAFDKVQNFTMADRYRRELEELENFEKSWRGKVQKFLSNRGLSESRSYGLWPTEYTGSIDFIDKLIKDYKEVTENLSKLNFDPKTESNVKEQKELIEAIADLLNIDLTTGKKKGAGKSELEKKIDALNALKKAYDSLKELNLGDTTIVKMLKDNFPDIVKTYGESFIDALDFTNRILEFGEQLKATEPDRAHSILQSLGLDDLSNDKKVIRDAIDAATKYFEAIRKWQSADFSIEGKGVAFDIGKIANSLTTKFNEIDLEAKKLAETLSQINLEDEIALEAIKGTFEKEFGQGSWDVFFKEFVSKGEQAITDFSEKEKNYERKLAQEKLNDMANKFVKESLEGMDLSHWGDKTISQIEAIRQQLITLMRQDIELPEGTIEKLKLLGLNTEDLIKKIQALFGEKLDNATTEKVKALSKAIKDTSSYMKTLGEDVMKLGESFENNGVKRLGNMLMQFEELAKILTECDALMQTMFAPLKDVTEEAADGVEKVSETADSLMKSGDIITLIAKIAISLFSNVVDGIVETQAALHEAEMAAIQFGNAMDNIAYNEMMESHKSILGADEYRQAADAMKQASLYMQSALDTAERVNSRRSFWQMDYMSASQIAKLNDSLEKQGSILVDARTAWQKWWGTGSDLLQTFNISDFIDEEGNLMGEKLREFMNAYGEHISEENEAALTEMLNDYDLYVQAIEDATGYLENLFGNVAGDMADAFVEAFKTSGEAALDYADIMDEVATNVAKSVVKSMILDNVVDDEKFNEMAKALLSDPAGAMAMLDEVMQAAQKLAPHIESFLKQMEPYFNMEDEAQSLGDGIKGVTEDTANLLASYLNAIRADVSYSRTLWERMDASTQQIAAALLGFSAPTLMEYQAQIAANTFNTAAHTQSIMNDLKSVITSEGGYTAIKTYS